MWSNEHFTKVAVEGDQEQKVVVGYVVRHRWDKQC
jgi:hypothetical protein